MSSSLSVDRHPSSAPDSRSISVALIGPDEGPRRGVSMALRESRRAEVFEFASYPPKPSYLQAVLENFNLLFLEIDSDPRLALELIEEAGRLGGIAIIAYSQKPDSNLAVRCMKAGAADCLLLPVDARTLSEVLDLASTVPSHTTHPANAPSRSPLGNAPDSSTRDSLPFSRTPSSPSLNNLSYQDNANLRPTGLESTVATAPPPASTIAPPLASVAKKETPSLQLENLQQASTLCAVQELTADDDVSLLQKPDDSFIDVLSRIASPQADIDTNSAPLSAPSRCFSNPSPAGKDRVREFGVEEMRDADAELFQMFRRESESSAHNNGAQHRWKTAVPIAVFSLVILLIALFAAFRQTTTLTVKQPAPLAGAATTMQKPEQSAPAHEEVAPPATAAAHTGTPQSNRTQPTPAKPSPGSVKSTKTATTGPSAPLATP